MKKTAIVLILSLIFILSSCAKTTDDISTEPVENNNTPSGTVTISITCDEILDNIDNLKTGKEYFVPSDGVILSETTVNVNDGDTAFDLLKSVCEKNDIQLDSDNSASYGTYIVGINQLYSGDCGNMSGWMYLVNGETLMVSVSDYVLQDGDSVTFTFSSGTEYME